MAILSDQTVMSPSKNHDNQTKSGNSNWPQALAFKDPTVHSRKSQTKVVTGQQELTTGGPFTVKAADGLRVEEVMVLRPRPDWGLS